MATGGAGAGGAWLRIQDCEVVRDWRARDQITNANACPAGLAAKLLNVSSSDLSFALEIPPAASTVCGVIWPNGRLPPASRESAIRLHGLSLGKTIAMDHTKWTFRGLLDGQRRKVPSQMLCKKS